MRTISSLFAMALAASMLCSAQTAPSKSTGLQRTKSASSVPDAIFFDGVIYTGAGFAEDKPQIVEAIAIGGGKVMASRQDR